MCGFATRKKGLVWLLSMKIVSFQEKARDNLGAWPTRTQALYWKALQGAWEGTEGMPEVILTSLLSCRGPKPYTEPPPVRNRKSSALRLVLQDVQGLLPVCLLLSKFVSISKLYLLQRGFPLYMLNNMSLWLFKATSYPFSPMPENSLQFHNQTLN